jgi:hypothetical protein
MDYIKKRLLGASTYLGIIYILAACALKFIPQFKDEIIMGAFGACGIISLIFQIPAGIVFPP